ncbi:Disease resistance protein Piks-2 [Camellia lanceoleosa]|uniref:Disease resistance protein Piks-2 n=1 Tax=Camellia lanceoleosa TaxID=1840588 RepID=A0ACC0ILF8_9ERIC|nr:Disease resistance protein Piks-2 [Camellia lanceoleosa]
MAESAVTFLLKKLSSLVEEELKSLGGVQAEIVFIRDELQSMSAFLRVADAIEDTDLKTWVHQVRDLAYHIDNILDQFTIRFAPHHHHRHGFFYESVHTMAAFANQKTEWTKTLIDMSWYIDDMIYCNGELYAIDKRGTLKRLKYVDPHIEEEVSAMATGSH